MEGAGKELAVPHAGLHIGKVSPVAVPAGHQSFGTWKESKVSGRRKDPSHIFSCIFSVCSAFFFFFKCPVKWVLTEVLRVSRDSLRATSPALAELVKSRPFG